MKKHRNKDRQWKEEMFRHWENVACTYREMREKPTFRCVVKVFLGVLRILAKILVRRLLNDLFDDE